MKAGDEQKAVRILTVLLPCLNKLPHSTSLEITVSLARFFHIFEGFLRY